MKKILFSIFLFFFNINFVMAEYQTYNLVCYSTHEKKLDEPYKVSFFKFSPGAWKTHIPGKNEPRFNVYGGENVDKKIEGLQWTYAQILSEESGFLFMYILEINKKRLISYLLELDKNKIADLKSKSIELDSIDFDHYKLKMVQKEKFDDVYAGHFKDCEGSIYEAQL